MRTKVKICGLTRLTDALAAVEAGADALGFMFFAESKRHITTTAAANVIRPARKNSHISKFGGVNDRAIPAYAASCAR